MRDLVWEAWEESFAARRDDPSTWGRVPFWKAYPKPKRHPVFRTILGAQLCRTADLLLGPGWSTSRGFGNLLAAPPDAETWHLPGRDGLWHMDSRFERGHGHVHV